MPCDACGKHACRQRLYTLQRDQDTVARFCSINCAMLWAAEHSAPTQECGRA